MASPADNQDRKGADKRELRDILEAFSDDGVTVERVLKNSEWERTELVRIDGETRIRKTIRLLDGQRSAYETVFVAQQSGSAPIHIPRIIDCKRLGNDLVAVMERVPGETIERAVLRSGGSEEVALELFLGVCEAVNELHMIEGGPIIHRDIKPTNVMVCRPDKAAETVVSTPEESPAVFLIDLGIARTYRDDAVSDTQHFGTPGYAPPEQFGYGQTGVASDVYALGMLLYFCLTGKEPSASLREGDVPFAGAPARYRSVLVKATEFDPKARFASVEELREAFLAASSSIRRACRRANGLAPLQ